MTQSTQITGKSTYEWVRLGDMVVVDHCQRDNDPRFQAAIVERGFDPDIMGTPVLSERNGAYRVLDGQQRTGACRQWLGAGWEDQRIFCQVFHDLNDVDEARIFLDLNYHKAVQRYQKYDKAVRAKLEPETSIDAVVHACGLRVATKSGPGKVRSVAALEDVYRKGNGKILAKTLCIILDAWGDESAEGDLIKGIGLVCQRYGDAVDQKRAVAKLSAMRAGPRGLRNAAESLKAKTGWSTPVAVAAAVVDVYNRGRGGVKLPPWQS